MPIASVTELIATLSRLHVLEASQINDLNSRAAAFRDCQALTRDLVERGWITGYQANCVLQERGHELVLGSYVVLDKLGEGGMGTVYRARNWKLGRITAIKVIRKERLAGSDAERRFQREIRAAAQLEHVNVVRAYDADEVNGNHFFAMEYVEGIDLSKLVREHGPLPAALACDYIRQAALGLQHAHERGLVHRDIKPGNLLLARGSKGAGTVKVLDMGLARQDEGASEYSGTLTQVGMLMGTPDYMAPEQSVSARHVDARADLYSLGCTLYFLLTGSVPFPGGSLTEKLLKHQMEQPKPLEVLRPDVPAEVADTMYKLLAKKPEERFQTAAELAEKLAGLLQNPKVWETKAVKQTFRSAAASKKAESPSEYQTDPFWHEIVAEAFSETIARKQRPRRMRWLLLGGTACLLVLGLIIAWNIAGSAPGDDPKKGQFAKEKGPAEVSVRPLDGLTLPPWSNTPFEATFDLLPLIDPVKDGAGGDWQLGPGGELLGVAPASSAASAQVDIPYQPPAEYDLRIAFTRTKGNDCMFPVLVGGGGRQFMFVLGNNDNAIAGFELLDGKQAGQKENRTGMRRAAWLQNNRRYETLFQVRRNGVSAYLDGEFLYELKTTFRDLSLHPLVRLRSLGVLGIGCYLSSMTFYRVEIAEISGPGAFTRYGDPAAQKAAVQRESAFKRLDNGKDLEGWTGMLNGWEVVDGCIHLDGNKATGDIYSTTRHGGNAIVRLQFRAARKADSGVYIHGKQLQVRDYPNAGPSPYAKFAKPAGEWNDLEFDISDGVAVVMLNGGVIESAWKIGSATEKGVGLQRESGIIDYRNIRLKEK